MECNYYEIVTGEGITYQDAIKDLQRNVQKLMLKFLGWRPLGGVSVSNDICLDRVYYQPGKYYASQAMYLTERTKEEDKENKEIKLAEEKRIRTKRGLHKEIDN